MFSDIDYFDIAFEPAITVNNIDNYKGLRGYLFKLEECI